MMPKLWAGEAIRRLKGLVFEGMGQPLLKSTLRPGDSDSTFLECEHCYRLCQLRLMYVVRFELLLT